MPDSIGVAGTLVQVTAPQDSLPELLRTADGARKIICRSLLSGLQPPEGRSFYLEHCQQWLHPLQYTPQWEALRGPDTPRGSVLARTVFEYLKLHLDDLRCCLSYADGLALKELGDQVKSIIFKKSKEQRYPLWLSAYSCDYPDPGSPSGYSTKRFVPLLVMSWNQIFLSDLDLDDYITSQNPTLMIRG